MADIQLKAEKREKLGGSSAEELRRKGRVPGVLYGHGEASIPFHVKELDLRPLIYTQETHTISLSLGGQTSKAILREVQFNPVTDRVRHIDLIILHAGEKIRVDIPVSLVGTAAGSKDGGIVDHILHKLTVEVLPESIPERIEIDITDLRIGHSLHVRDLSAHGSYVILGDENAVIVACAAPKAQEEVVAPDAVAAAAATPAEPEQIKAKGKKEEEE